MTNSAVNYVLNINKKNSDLIIFESNYIDYSSELNDSKLLGINASINSKFKFLVSIDLTKCRITSTKDKITINVNTDNIQLKDVSMLKPSITYDINALNSLRGKKIIDTLSELLKKSYDDIDKIVKKEFESNKELYKLNLQNKLNEIYYIFNDVKVVFD